MKVLFVLGLQDKVKMGFEGAVVGVMVMMGMVMLALLVGIDGIRVRDGPA